MGRGISAGANTFVFQLTVPLSINGTYTISGKFADGPGNLRELDYRFTYDNQPPDIDRIELVSGNQGTRPLNDGESVEAPFNTIVAGVTDDTSGVEWTETRIILRDNAGRIIPGVLQSANGLEAASSNQPPTQISWLLNDSSQLRPGLYTTEVVAVDRAGNSTTKSLTFGFSDVPQLSPTVVAVVPGHGERLSADMGTGAIHQVVAGVADRSGTGIDFERSRITVEAPGGTEQGEAGKGEGDTLVWTFPHALATDGSDDGEYTVHLTVVDNAGNSTEPPQTVFFYDTTPPQLSGSGVFPAAGAFLNTAVDQVSVTLEDPAGIALDRSSIELVGPDGPVSGRQTHNGIDTLIWTFPRLPSDGAYQIRVQAVDKVGNSVALPLTTTFTRDTQAPVVSSSVPPVGATVTLPLEAIIVTLDDRNGGGVDLTASRLKVFRRGIATDAQATVAGMQGDDGRNTLIWTFDRPLASDGSDDGIYSVEIIPHDILGNAPEKPVTFEFIYTVRAPALVSTNPAQDTYFNEPLSQVTAVLHDRSGAGIDVSRSNLVLQKGDGQEALNGALQVQLTEAGYTLTLMLNRRFATDGSADGPYTLRVTGIDNVGSTAAYDVGFVFDTQAPRVVTVDPPEGFYNTSPARVSARLVDDWTAVDLVNSSVQLVGPSGPVAGHQTNDGNDTINWELTGPIDDGVYTIRVVPADILNNQAVASFESQFYMDTAPPTVLRTEPPEGTLMVDTQLSEVRAVLTDGENGSGVDISKSAIQLIGPKGEVQGTETAAPSENLLVFTLGAPLARDGSDDGRYTIKVFASDRASNRADLHEATFVYDTIQPGSPAIQNISVQPVALSPNSDGASDVTQVSYILSEPATVTVQITDARLNVLRTLVGSEALSAGTQAIAWDGTDAAGMTLVDGAYTVTFDARDAAGLTSAFESVNVVIDTQPPVLSRLTVSDNPFTPDGDGFADILRLGFTVSNASPLDAVSVIFQDSAGNQIATVSADPKFKGNGSYAATWNGLGASADGEYSYTIQAKDTAANARKLTGTVALDKNGPQIEITEPKTESIATSEPPLHLRGSATDFSGVRTVEVRILRQDGSALIGWQQIPLNRVGEENGVQSKVSWEYEFTPPSDDVYTITIRATDQVGHTQSHPPLRIDYDNTPPQIVDVRVEPPDRTYKNGDTITIHLESDNTGYTVKADFSFVDSEYKPGAETVTDLKNNGYRISYTLSPDNTQATDRTRANLPIPITVSDEKHTSRADTFTIDLDNQPPSIEITSPTELQKEGQPLTTTASEINIQGKTEPHSSITVSPASLATSYNPETGLFSFNVMLTPGGKPGAGASNRPSRAHDSESADRHISPGYLTRDFIGGGRHGDPA